MVLTVFSGWSPTYSVQQYTSKEQKSQNDKITRGPVWLFVFLPLANWSSFQHLSTNVEGMKARRGGKGGQNVQGESEAVLVVSRALVVEVGLFNAPAEGHQVAVALDPLGQLAARQPGGDDGEEVAEHQCIQLRRPAKQKSCLIAVWCRHECRRCVVFDTLINGDTVPSYATHKLENVSACGLTGSLEDLWCV